MRRLRLPPLLLILAAPAAASGAESSSIPPEAPTSGPRPLERAWSLSLGTGGGSFFEFADGLAGRRPAGYEERSGGRIQLDARLDRELGRRFRSGLAYVYLGWSNDYSAGGVGAGTIHERAQVLMLDFTVRWYRGERVETYSGIAAGYGRWTARGTVGGVVYDDTQAGPAFQLRYFGVSWGGDRFRLFADLGIGFEGLVVGGLTVRL